MNLHKLSDEKCASKYYSGWQSSKNSDGEVDHG